MNLLLPLAITLAIETGVYMILKHRDMKLFVFVSILNIVLNLSMNFGLSFIQDEVIYWIVLGTSEVTTVFIETTAIYFFLKEKYRRILLYSFIANLASFLIGLALTPIYQTVIAAIVVTCVFLLVYLFTFGFILFCYLNNQFRQKEDANHSATHDGD